MLERRFGGLQILFAFPQRAVLLLEHRIFVKDRPIGRFEGPQCAIKDPQRQDANGRVNAKTEQQAEQGREADAQQQIVERNTVLDKAHRVFGDDDRRHPRHDEMRRHLAFGQHELARIVDNPMAAEFVWILRQHQQFAQAAFLILPHLPGLIDITREPVGAQIRSE